MYIYIYIYNYLHKYNTLEGIFVSFHTENIEILEGNTYFREN